MTARARVKHGEEPTAEIQLVDNGALGKGVRRGNKGLDLGNV